MRFRAIWLAVGALLLAGALMAQDSLGDVARKQRAGAAKKASKVVTNDDLPDRPSAPPVEAKRAESAEATAAEQKPAADAKEAPKTTGPNADAKSEREVMLSRIEDLKYAEDAERRIMRKMEKGLAEEGSEFRRRMYQETLDHAREQLDKYKAERTELEQKTSAGNQSAPATEQKPQAAPQSQP